MAATRPREMAFTNSQRSVGQWVATIFPVTRVTTGRWSEVIVSGGEPTRELYMIV